MSSKTRKKKSGYVKVARAASNWNYQAFDHETITRRAENTRGLSERLDRALDLIGYCPEIVKMRRDLRNQEHKIANNQDPEIKILTVGSKGDGVSCLDESDTDLLVVFTKIVACFPDERHPIFGQKIGVFLHQDNCQPGYLKLKLPRWYDSECKNLKNMDGCISAKMVKELVFKSFCVNEKLIGYTAECVTGPAVTLVLGGSAMDFVVGIPYKNAKRLLKQWVKRKRKYEWPDQELIKKVLENPACIVPVGWKDKFQNETDTWHFSFVEGEKELSNSLQPAEYKLYILLKRLNTQYLKPLCDSVSSYMMKNIVFWLVEVTPRGSINNGTLLEYLLAALGVLRKHILDGRLKHYLIEDRNLMQNKWSSNVAAVLVAKIDFLVQKGLGIVFTLSKIGPALQSEDSLSRRQIDLVMRKRHRLEFLAKQLSAEIKQNINILAPITLLFGFTVTVKLFFKDYQIRHMLYALFRTCWPEWLAYVEGVYDEDITSDVAESKALQEKRFPPKMLKDLSEVLVGHIIKEHCLSGDLLHDEHVKQRVLDVSDVLYIRMDRLSK